MPYVNTKDILEKASQEFYAVPALNINNLEFLQAIIEAGLEERAPVIIETSEGAIKYAGNGNIMRGAKLFVDMVREYADSIDIPVALHLDHGKHFEYIVAAIKAGYSSVMIDASEYAFEENLSMTKKIVEIAHSVDVSVEAELGRLVGIEDNVVVDAHEAALVDPDEAVEFVEKSGVDFLAPAIGTSHGAFKFKGEAKLDYDRLKKVKERTGIPLVLHGASSVPQDIVKLAEEYGASFKGARGVPSEILKETVKYGINKVNTDTDLRMAFIAGLREFLAGNPTEFDPRKYFKVPKEYVKKLIRERMRLLGCSNKA
ncbi:MAG: class II fructose-1,6-bisphosphate aldolase [Thermotogae bacterium]|uniref:Class II fructose-1,6-bisphosphate aldolase n=1 Tax=Kosmotoga arenicorallina TaxID=688066 RepID=A0A7C5HWW2_9BACT|nr:class II fructose-1,6-bisphosphate aldolase [Kosmotoga sp.]MBO8165639.1 class II fructose-1,6-bisphosphate aldolase [Kosmotoga sp.]MCD6159897.1 class II fructose-1,6-bisphosphate aldolase [Kosmotoga sp.]RKX50851.1 MAG: class II fructose-1,6-bisphosphate aldolase [Thermotogota bacterium]HHF08769.1 class II fructose-1,6-bisphosphate aldolase [Kosmotoga arenicorallina]